MSTKGEINESKAVTDYCFRHYVDRHCTLCGNWGVIDSRGVKTPAGVPTGRLNYCLCPNGQAMRERGVDLAVMVHVQRTAPKEAK